MGRFVASVVDYCRILTLGLAAQYPAYDSLLKSIEIEAEQNVKRLRHHPSVVIFGSSARSPGTCFTHSNFSSRQQ